MGVFRILPKIEYSLRRSVLQKLLGLLQNRGFTFLKKSKGIVKKRNCPDNFQYRLNFSKKKLKVRSK